MSLASKYGISESAVKAMIKDGWITCNAKQYEEIYYYYREKKKSYSTVEAVMQTSITFKCSDRWVYDVIKKFE